MPMDVLANTSQSTSAYQKAARHALTKLAIAVSSAMLFTVPVHALEKISDEELSDHTGQSLGLTLENFSFVMEDDDASYINVIPRGELSATASAAGQERADIYLRNVAITRNDSTTTRASETNITSWGSGYNPFVFKVSSEDAPTYDRASESLAYFQFEAPNYCPAGAATTSDCPDGEDTLDALDAYNLRLGLMADLLIKSDTESEGYGSLTGTNISPADGLSLQGIWNGLSINGTRVAFFQTPDGAANDDYNNTFGLRGLVRLNTDESQANNGLRLTAALDSGYNGTTNRLFNDQEGLRLSNLDVNLPLGAPNYQSLILGKEQGSPNFYAEVTRIPNNPAAYNAAYIDYNDENQVRDKTCTSMQCGAAGIPATHGTIRTGDLTFTAPNGDSVNVGSNAIDGVFIQHLKFTTTGL